MCGEKGIEGSCVGGDTQGDCGEITGCTWGDFFAGEEKKREVDLELRL